MSRRSSYHCIVCLKDKENVVNDFSKTLFKFPESPGRKRKWLQVLEIQESDIKKRSKVCERHFSHNQFLGRMKLKKDAIPTTSNKKIATTAQPVFMPTSTPPCESACVQQSASSQARSTPIVASGPTAQLILPALLKPLMVAPMTNVSIPISLSQLLVHHNSLQSGHVINQPFSPAHEISGTSSGLNQCTAATTAVERKPKSRFPVTAKETPVSKTSTRQYKQRISNLLRKIKQMKAVCDKKVDLDGVFSENPGFCKIIKDQVKRYTEKRSPYTQFEKALGLSLYYSCGKNGYRTLISLGLKLPMLSTLRNWMGGFQFDTGYNAQIFDCIGKVLEGVTDKNCVLMWDEMSIKEWMEYNKFADKFEGIIDFGEEGRRLETANEVLVFMIHGIKSPWKFPIGFYFSKNATPTTTLEKLVRSTIQKLSETGLKVRLCVCDMSFTNQGLYRSLSVSEETPFSIIGEERIYFIHDAPHLIKLVRNNLNKHDFILNGNEGYTSGIMKWNHIVSFYNKDRRTPSRMAPKLTNAHLELRDFSKMRVKLAVQLLSFSVYSGIVAMHKAGILKDDTLVTAHFIKMIDEIFDFLNTSSYSRDKFGRCAKVYFKNLHKIDEYIKFLNSVELVGVTRTAEFLSGLKITLKGIKLLSYDLQQEGFTVLYTRRFQQDSLENFFSAVRMKGGNCKNPTARQFRLIFRSLFFCHMMINPTTGNCESIRRKFFKSLQSVENILRVTSSKMKPQTQTSFVKSSTAAEFYNVKVNRRLKLGDDQEAIVASYVGASSIKSVASSKNCEKCKEMLLFDKPNDLDTILIDAKQYDPLSNSLSYLNSEALSFFNFVNKDFLRTTCKVLDKSGLKILENIFSFFETFEVVREWLSGGECDVSHRSLIFKYFLRSKMYRLVKDKNEIVRKIKSWSQSRREMRNQ